MESIMTLARKRVRDYEPEDACRQCVSPVDFESEDCQEHDQALFALARTQRVLHCVPSLPGQEPFWITPEPRTTTRDATMLDYYQPKAEANVVKARSYMHTDKCPVVLAQPCVTHDIVGSSVIFGVSVIMQFPTVANGLLDVSGIQGICPGKRKDDIVAAGFSDWLYPHVSAKLSAVSECVVAGSTTFNQTWARVSVVYHRCRYVDGPHTGYLEIEDLTLHGVPVDELRLLRTDDQCYLLNQFVWRCFLIAMRMHMFGDLYVSPAGTLSIL